MNLVQLFAKYGTDKLSNGYAPLYHTLLYGQREQIRSMLEVGVGTMIPGAHSSMMGYAQDGYAPGGSLRAWRDYLPNAVITGIDVQQDTQVTEDRIETFLCDSTDTYAVDNAFGNRTFDFIIDDGSHIDTNQIRTLQNLYRRVKPGGLYVIEDIYPGSNVSTSPKVVGDIVGHNEYFFSGLKSNLCVIFAQPLTPYDRKYW